MTKILWVKFGWSDHYRGDDGDDAIGDFDWMTEEGGDGHEKFNFLPGPDGAYYCYVPPHGASQSSPSSLEPHGWKVICLAKRPRQKGVNVVGWYENATLMGELTARPEYAAGLDFPRPVHKEKDFLYAIRATRAFFVPPKYRTRPYSHTAIRQAAYSYLSGPGIKANKNKAEILAALEAELARVTPLVIAQPNQPATTTQV